MGVTLLLGLGHFIANTQCFTLLSSKKLSHFWDTFPSKMATFSINNLNSR